jgi:beta-N-acetylhexosaminidase
LNYRSVVAAAASVCVVALGLSACAAQPDQEPEQFSLPPREVSEPLDPAVSYAQARLSVMSVREKVGSVLMMHRAGTSAEDLRSFVDTYGLGGIILMGDNIPAVESDLASITSSVSADGGLPILIGIDQEGGIVRRLTSDTAASPAQLRGLPMEATREAFTARSQLLADLGVSVNFGIVADVTDDKRSFIYSRVLGTTSSESAARVAEAVAGEQSRALSTLKHFPGHGVAPGDSHREIPSSGISYDGWLSTHAPSFRSGIDAGAEFVMFGHLALTSVDHVPASLSLEWHDILRDELGFDGVAITDDMRMLQDSRVADYADPVSNAIGAINAGNTMVLFVGGVDPGYLVDSLLAAVDDGRIAESTIDDAVLKLLVTRRELSGQTGPFISCFDECRELVD